MNRESYRKYLIYPSLKALTAFAFVAISYICFFGDGKMSRILFVLSIAFTYGFLFYLAPIMILFFTHRASLKGKSLTLNGNKLIIKAGDLILVCPDDLPELEIHQTISAHHKRFDWSLWGHYGFYLLRNDQGQQISLSFLLTEGLDLETWKNNINRKRRVFPIPSKDILTKKEIIKGTGPNPSKIQMPVEPC